MAIFTPYHRFGNYQIIGSGDYNQSAINTALAGVYTGTPDDERLRNNVDSPSNPVRLYNPIVTNNNTGGNTNFSSIIPSDATITGVQIRFYYKWFSGDGLYFIDSKLGLNGGSLGTSLGAVSLNTSFSSATLNETEVLLGGLSLTPSNIDDIELNLIFNRIFGNSPRVAIMGAGFGDTTYEASPAIRIQYTSTNAVNVTNNSKIHITGTSKLTVN